MVKVGDAYSFVPEAFYPTAQPGPGGKASPTRVTGRVVWIHPRRRFFLVEATVGGAIIRETFPIKHRKEG